MEYIIPIEWSMISAVKVEAASLDEAIEKVEDPEFPLPSDGEYIDGSFSVNHDCVREMNK